VACFHGVTGYRYFLELALGHSARQLTLGQQLETVNTTSLYVVPNPSPANARFTLADQTAWYDRLADFLAAKP
jgi:TDG/mug DNA glycosylase family protein